MPAGLESLRWPARDHRARCPVPAAAGGVRAARPLRARQADDRPGRRGRVPPGPADQRRRGPGCRGGLLRGAARPQGPHAGRHAGPAAAPEEIWIDTEPVAPRWPVRHLEMYTIGRDVDGRGRGRDRALLSLIGPRSVEVAGDGGPAASTPAKRRQSPASSALRSGPRDGVDLIAPNEEADRLREALTAAGAVEVGPEAAEVLRIEAGKPRFGAEMSGETMPAEAGIVEDGRQLHEGLLHRPGAGRPPPLQGEAEPPSARARAERTRRPGHRRCDWARRRSGGSAAPASPPPAAPIGLAIVRREAEPGARAHRR